MPTSRTVSIQTCQQLCLEMFLLLCFIALLPFHFPCLLQNVPKSPLHEIWVQQFNIWKKSEHYVPSYYVLVKDDGKIIFLYQI